MWHVTWSYEGVYLGDAWLTAAEYRAFIDYLRVNGWDHESHAIAAEYDPRGHLDPEKAGTINVVLDP